MSNVYAITHPNGFIKIGKSDNPFKRMEALQTASPYDLTLQLVMPTDGNAEQIEHEIHERLSEYHWRGEWFNVTQTVVQNVFTEYVENSDSSAYKLQEVGYSKSSKTRKEIERSLQTEFVKATELNRS